MGKSLSEIVNEFSGKAHVVESWVLHWWLNVQHLLLRGSSFWLLDLERAQQPLVDLWRPLTACLGPGRCGAASGLALVLWLGVYDSLCWVVVSRQQTVKCEWLVALLSGLKSIQGHLLSWPPSDRILRLLALCVLLISLASRLHLGFFRLIFLVLRRLWQSHVVEIGDVIVNWSVETHVESHPWLGVGHRSHWAGGVVAALLGGLLSWNHLLFIKRWRPWLLDVTLGRHGSVTKLPVLDICQLELLQKWRALQILEIQFHLDLLWLLVLCLGLHSLVLNYREPLLLSSLLLHFFDLLGGSFQLLLEGFDLLVKDFILSSKVLDLHVLLL